MFMEYFTNYRSFLDGNRYQTASNRSLNSVKIQMCKDKNTSLTNILLNSPLFDFLKNKESPPE